MECFRINFATFRHVRLLLLRNPTHLLCRSTSSKSLAKDFNVETYFIKPDVQRILKKITGFNLEKVYRESKIADIEPPKYKLLTSQQLEQYKADAIHHAHSLLEMPPVKNPWSPEVQVLSVDDIAHFEKRDHRYVFTDITYGVPRRERVVTVREPDGTLRLTNSEEHDRILHVYYPQPGKMYAMPKMFEEEYLEKVLGEHRYEYILDRACIQFEPDDPNYIRVSHRTYEHITNHGRFNDLRSTRHFGPMAFYLATQSRIDGLLVDMLQNGLLSDASDLVALYHILHPQCKSCTEVRRSSTVDPEQIVLLFAQLDATNSGAIELALRSHKESSSVNAASVA